jgi:hypothetical protein
MDFTVFQSRGNEALSVDQGLCAEILRGYMGQVGFTDLDIITKDFIKTDP